MKHTHSATQSRIFRALTRRRTQARTRLGRMIAYVSDGRSNLTPPGDKQTTLGARLLLRVPAMRSATCTLDLALSKLLA